MSVGDLLEKVVTYEENFFQRRHDDSFLLFMGTFKRQSGLQLPIFVLKWFWVNF